MLLVVVVVVVKHFFVSYVLYWSVLSVEYWQSAMCQFRLNDLPSLLSYQSPGEISVVGNHIFKPQGYSFDTQHNTTALRDWKWKKEKKKNRFSPLSDSWLCISKSMAIIVKIQRRHRHSLWAMATPAPTIITTTTTSQPITTAMDKMDRPLKVIIHHPSGQSRRHRLQHLFYLVIRTTRPISSRLNPIPLRPWLSHATPMISTWIVIRVKWIHFFSLKQQRRNWTIRPMVTTVSETLKMLSSWFRRCVRLFSVLLCFWWTTWMCQLWCGCIATEHALE